MRLFSLSLLLFFAFSQAYFGKKNEGLAVFGWAMLLQSPRTVAFEGAGSALPSQDFGAALMNPALLQDTGFVAGAAWQSGYLADMQGILAFSHPLSIGIIKGKMQHTYGVVYNGEVSHYDEYGEPTGDVSYPASQYYAITLAFPLKHVKFGVTGRYLWEKLSELPDARTGMGLAMDWGFLWNSGSARYGLGLMGRHLGRQITPFMKGGVNGYALASELAASAFWRSSRDLTWLFECAAPRYSPALGKLGLEYRFSEPIFIRAGMQKEFIDLVGRAGNGSGYYRLFSAGAGYRLFNIAVDYSYSMLVEGMGSEHRIGLSGVF